MGNIIKFELSERLEMAAEYVRRGAVFADIGTDHAYLPIELVRRGIAVRAAACDIAEAPCRRAKQNIAVYGMSEKVDVMCTDGLNGIEKHQPTDICIAGMGAEMIIKIISESAYVKNNNINLILQPMTRAELLRGYLYENGFCISGESLAETEGKFYQIINCSYDGAERYASDIALLLGSFIISCRPKHFHEFIRHKISIYEKRLDGMLLARGVNTDETDRLRALIVEMKALM